MNAPIQSALISVFYKDGLDEIVKALHKKNVTLYSTGGTRKFIEDLGIPCVAVEDITGYPSILGGRVKTLHPKVFGGIFMSVLAHFSCVPSAGAWARGVGRGTGVATGDFGMGTGDC